jgi:hypothetical protein
MGLPHAVWMSAFSGKKRGKKRGHPECHEVKRNFKVALHLRSIVPRLIGIIVDMCKKLP